MKWILITLAGGILLATSGRPVAAAETELCVTVEAGQHDRTDTPATVTLQLPADVAGARSVTLTCPAGKQFPGQLTAPGLLNPAVAKPGSIVRELHFIVPSLKQGESMDLKATISTASSSRSGFAWKHQSGQYAELAFDGRPMMRYMCRPFDTTSKETKEQTDKVFHHLYDSTGTRLVTNGGRGGLYPHHRGLFFGFSKISYGDSTRANTWAGAASGHEQHRAFLAEEAGPVLGRHRVAVDWVGPDAEPANFAVEKRQMTAYCVSGGTLVEFASRLSSKAGKVKLDGDPQHAGFQFRAHNDVAENSQAQTYFLRSDGKGALGETRNWSHKDRDSACANLPWNAISFVLGDRRYTCVYVDKPTNPKEARYSERTYGRFGSYFEYELDDDTDLDLNYRVWLQDGEMMGEQAEALSSDFVDPVEVTVHN